MEYKKCKIPFSGFYNSIHDDNFDCYISYEVNENRNAVERINELIDWKASHIAYCKKYIELINSEYDLNLEFHSTWSPKYYNYETDEIYANIKTEELKTIFEKTDKTSLQKNIAEMFTSHPGFISFYPNKLEDFPADLEDWDTNHIHALLQTYFEQEYRFSDDWESSLVESYCELCMDCLTSSPENNKIINHIFNNIFNNINKE